MNKIIRFVFFLVLVANYLNAMEEKITELNKFEIADFNCAVISIESFLCGDLEISNAYDTVKVILKHESCVPIVQDKSYFTNLFQEAQGSTLEKLKSFMTNPSVNYHPDYIRYYAQLVRLREFLEVASINDFYEETKKRISDLKVDKGDTYLKENFGDTNVFRVTVKLITYANNRINYINAFKANNCKDFNEVYSKKPLQFKFVQLPEYLERLLKLLEMNVN